jgi:alginate O-acetyltransferase complex protein AlgI
MGGNRGSGFATLRNLLLTMLIGGLWHGANWTFLIWGAYHGFLLILYRLFSGRWDQLPAGIATAITFLLVVVSWVPFRSPDLTTTASLLTTMFSWKPGLVAGPNAEFLVLVLFAGWWAIWGPNCSEAHAKFRAGFRWTLGSAAAFGACLAFMAGGRSSPFLYFQF